MLWRAVANATKSFSVALTMKSAIQKPKKKLLKPKTKPAAPRDTAPPAFFNADVLGAEAAAAAQQSFASAHPYTYVKLHGLLDESRLLKVRNELAQLRRTFKETDLFKVFQTGDLANIDPNEPLHAAELSETIALREALYSDAFRGFVRRVTGCAPLIGQTDLSCNVYSQGGHLLCHDDVIGTRCVSFILYLSRPGKPWKPKFGGALELYDTDEVGGPGCPETAPCVCVGADWGTLLMFTVQPGVSFHAVSEVLGTEPRLSVSGWFHAATPPPRAAEMATLAQLQAATPTAGGGGGSPPSHALPTLSDGAISPKQLRALAKLVNPAYLKADALGAVRAQLQAHGSAQLAQFLLPEVAAPLLAAAAEADRRDKLGRGGPPRYAAGLKRRGWRAVGPPHKQRYLRHTGAAAVAAATDGAAADGADGAAAAGAVGAQLQALRKLMRSAPFAQLVALLGGAAPSAVRTEVRRFRPGLDYTLAHVGTLRPTLTIDATLTFVPPAAPADGGGGGGGAAAARAAAKEAAWLWAGGDVGGFECYVASDEGEDTAKAAEVYRADDASEGVTSIHAISNALNLTLRPPGTMKFVKYVSAAAPGSRWDVSAEFTC